LQLPNYICSAENSGFSQEKILKISAKNRQLNELETKINELFASDLMNNFSPYPYLSQS